MTPHLKTFCRLLIVLLLAGLVLSACGRKAPPQPPLQQPAVENETQLEESPTLGGEDAPTQPPEDAPPAVPPYP
ncbi:hypothetical protein ACTRW9_04635 [Nitrospina sp. 32_T5]|uniref:hypothetical protein n=1 Tax=unclassified Nitrospina TaxID=2638683 RepID=UPI003F9BAB57